MDTSAAQDILPSAFHASNGSIWLAWQTLRFSSTRPDIVYKVSNGTYGDLNSGSWGTVGRLTSSNFNSSPSLAQLQNGTIIIFWSESSTVTPFHFTINYERCCTFNKQLDIFQWSPAVHLTSSALNDTSPSAAMGADGRLWLFFERSNVTSSNGQIYYKTLVNGAWSADTKITSDTANLNVMPSGMVGKDGVVRLAFSKGPVSTATYNMYYTSYNSTTNAWASPVQIVPTTSGNSDEHASLMQDRNGTIWLFWGRLLGVGGSNPFYVLMSQFSTNNAKSGSWSVVTQIGSESSGIDDKQPSAVQANSPSDKSMHIFISSDRTGNDYNIWAYNSPSISPIHDLGITFASPSTTLMFVGGFPAIGESSNVTVDFTVQNYGDTGEKAQATVTATNTSAITVNLGSQTKSIAVGLSASYSFSWNTTGAHTGEYSFNISVASTNSTETIGNKGDNAVQFYHGTRLLPWDDIDEDGFLSIIDINIVIFDYGATPGTSRWQPLADINNNGIIDIVDANYAVAHYGATG